jgi:1D-myo-inositol 3-kinase
MGLMSSLTVLVCGHVTLDRYGTSLLPGGSAYYAAHAYRGLGARARVATAAGADFPEREALAGLEVSLELSRCTTTFVNVYAPDGTRSQRVEAAAPALDPRRLPVAWAEPDLLHLAPVLGEVDAVAWCSAVPARFVGIGVQGWVRSVKPDGRVTERPWTWEGAGLEGIDAACLGEDDLRGQGDLLDRLVAAVPIVAFTHGVRGCDVIVRGRTHRVGVYPAQEVDPTGAGDVFSAAFFLALASGADPAEAGRLGAAAASIVVEGRGGEALCRVCEARRRQGAVPCDVHADGRLS